MDNNGVFPWKMGVQLGQGQRSELGTFIPNPVRFRCLLHAWRRDTDNVGMFPLPTLIWEAEGELKPHREEPRVGFLNI